MADRKISDLTALTTPATGDLIPIVDISEAAAADKNKSITVGELLRGAPDGTAAAPGFAFESDGGNGMFLGGTDILAFSTGGSQAVTIDASQRLGVGTSSPSALFSVFQSAEGEIANFGTSDTSRLLRVVTGTANSISGALITLKTDSAEGEIAFGTGGGTERMRIDSDGFVGIGTTSPINALHINGTANATSSRIRVSTTEGSGFTIIPKSSTETMLNVDSSENLLFGVGGGEIARFDSSGRLLVGASLAPNSETSANLQLVHANGPQLIFARNDTEASTNEDIGLIRFYGNDSDGNYDECARIAVEAASAHTSTSKPTYMRFYTNGGSEAVSERMRISSTGQLATFDSSGFAHTIESSRSAGTSDYFIFGRHSSTSITGTGGTQSFAVYTNGNVQNTNNSYGALSDIKLKENIVDASSQWNDLKAIQVRNYNFKEGQTHTQIGVVAQEVELVSPGLVSETPDRDEEGNDLGTTTKSVNYSVLYMKAVKALQEAMERIETLEAKVAALEAN